MSWAEARLHPGCTPADLYGWLDERPGWTHHFWDEPWWPGAYVVRLDRTQADVGECPAVSHLAFWDERPDQALYGEFWIDAIEFFEAGSILSLKENDWERGKFVHCYLNAQGMSVRDEFWFALKFAWGRLTLRPRLWWRRRKS